MRVRKDVEARHRMCARLAKIIDVLYDNDAEVARIMGYANSSPLYRVRTKDAFPDVERLERLVNASPARGVTINLNWIVAGRGFPLLSNANGEVTGITIGTYVDRYQPSRKRL